MAGYEPEVIISQSLLDRLTDYAPEKLADPPMTRGKSFADFKGALRRDLEWLLNTRQTPQPAPAEFCELPRSLFNYGLPDLSSLSAQSVRDRNRLTFELEKTVQRFEPRLADVKVTMEPAPMNSRVLRFRIDALARIDPAPERVSFDTVLELTSGEYQVK